MRILHVAPCFRSSAGGIAYALKNIAESLGDFDAEQVILTAGEPDMSVAGVEIVAFPDVGNFRAHHGFSAWLQDNVRRFDVVHIHSIWLFHSRLAAKSAREAGVPYIVSPCGMLDDWSLSQKALKKRLYLFLFENRVLEHAAALHCTVESESQSDCVRRLGAPTAVVPLAIENAFFEDAPLERNPKQILFLGRLHPVKQPHVLIAACTALIAEEPDLRLVIAGAGDNQYVERLTRLAKPYMANVAFVGMITGRDKVRLFRQSGLFALPSLHENFGIAVAEGMASGAVPVISSAVALSDVVASQQAGFVSGTDVDSLRHTLASALADKAIDEKRSRCQRYASSHFSQRAVGKQFWQTYRDCAVAGQSRTVGVRGNE